MPYTAKNSWYIQSEGDDFEAVRYTSCQKQEQETSSRASEYVINRKYERNAVNTVGKR